VRAASGNETLGATGYPKPEFPAIVQKMAQQSSDAWLVRITGVEAGVRHPLTETVRIGRGTRAEIMVRGESAEVTSSLHAELRRENDGGFRIIDLGSTNGLYLNGQETSEARLAEGAVIELGRGGPRYQFTRQQEGANTAFGQATEATINIGAAAARISREAVKAVKHPSQRLRYAGWAALGAVLAAATGSWLHASALGRNHGELSMDSERLERALDETTDLREREALIARIDEVRREMGALEDSVWFGWVGSVRERSLVEKELDRLLQEFGAETTNVPGEVVERVEAYIELYQTTERTVMERALDETSPLFGRMRSQFEEESLPPDLAYLALVESGLRKSSQSRAGALGLWQLRPPTARQYGLRVDGETDERLDPIKSTEAAAKYLKRLILEFGSGSSVMLALAAYNVGPTRVKLAVRKIDDPIRQRNFWFLYRARRLPPETREYVPKVLAVMLIGRRPERFGFE